MPFMRIDSPTVFLKLLDKEKGGHFSIHPINGYTKSTQFYLTHTNILVTRFHTETGVAEITDFMPVNEHEFRCAIIKQVKVVIGKVSLQMGCIPSFDYARSEHNIIQEHTGCLFTPKNDAQSPVRLSSNVHLKAEGKMATAQVELNEGEECFFLLEAEHSTSTRNGDTDLYLNHETKDAGCLSVYCYSIWLPKKKVGYLTKEEIQRIESADFDVDRLNKVADFFVFSIYSGLAYTKILNLSKEHLVQGVDGELWISMYRQKTKKPYSVPLVPKAISIIDKYKDDPYCQKTGKIFPLPTNQKWTLTSKRFRKSVKSKQNSRSTWHVRLTPVRSCYSMVFQLRYSVNVWAMPTPVLPLMHIVLCSQRWW